MEKIEMKKMEEVHAGETELKHAVGVVNPAENYKEGAKVEYISVDSLVCPSYHPRMNPGDNIDELVNDAKRNGILSPLLVKKDAEGTFSIIDGCRRFEASKIAKITAVPCIVIGTVEDHEATHQSYVVNEQRKSFNPIERAHFFKNMKDTFGYSLKEMEVSGYGKSSSICNTIQLLELTDCVREKIVKGELTEAHGKQLLKLETNGQRERMAVHAAESQCSAAILERKITRLKEKGKHKKKENTILPAALAQDIENVYMKDSRNMAELKNNSVHFIMGSPPYGLNFEFEEGYSFETAFDETAEVLKECARVLPPGGVLALNVTDIQDHNVKTGNAERSEYLFTGHKFQKILHKHNIFLTDVIQWRKPVAWPNKLHLFFNENDEHTSYRFIKQTEQILVFRKKGAREVPDAEIVLSSRLSQNQWKAWAPSVWDINPIPGQNQQGHPCVFPEELCSRLIQMFSYVGDTVLDPWLGSGTTVKVARDLNRIGIGYERELKYKPVIMRKLGIEPLAGLADSKPIKMIRYVEEQLEASIPDKTAGANGQLVEDKSGFLPDLQGIAIDPAGSDSADQYSCSYV